MLWPFFHILTFEFLLAYFKEQVKIKAKFILMFHFSSNNGRFLGIVYHPLMIASWKGNNNNNNNDNTKKLGFLQLCMCQVWIVFCLVCSLSYCDKLFEDSAEGNVTSFHEKNFKEVNFAWKIAQIRGDISDKVRKWGGCLVSLSMDDWNSRKWSRFWQKIGREYAYKKP